MLMDEKLKCTIDKIVQLSKQNSEFDTELRKRLEMPLPQNVVSVGDNRIEQIYEYCIEKIVRKQAQEFYKDFPISSIINNLVEDYCRMESFRRKDNFGDFCLALYQQLECITNKLCVNPDLNEIVEKLWGYPAYVKTGKDIIPSIENRLDIDFTIASLVFPGQNKKTGLPYSMEKSMVSLQSQYAIDKIRIIVYFLGYKGMMKNSDFDAYVEFTKLLSDIYQCRNTNHRGNTLNTWEEETLNKVLSNKSVYYFKFLGALTQYVIQVKDGWNAISSMKKYAQQLSNKTEKIPSLKVLGQIELPNDGRKRFK